MPLPSGMNKVRKAGFVAPRRSAPIGKSFWKSGWARTASSSRAARCRATAPGASTSSARATRRWSRRPIEAAARALAATCRPGVGAAARHRLGGGEPALLPPFAVGPFWVHPSHVPEGKPAGLLPLRIDAGLAFAPAPTPRRAAVLEMLATLDPAETVNAVDVGCAAASWPLRWQSFGNGRCSAATTMPRRSRSHERTRPENGVPELCSFFVSPGLQAEELAVRAP